MPRRRETDSVLDETSDNDNMSEATGATRRKLARRQGGAAAAGLDREEAAKTLRGRKRSDGGTVRGSRAKARRNAGGRAGGDQVARGGRTSSDRTGLVAALNRGRTGRVSRGRAGKASGRTGNRGTNRTTARTVGATNAAGGRGRQSLKPGERTRSRAHKAGKKK